MSRIRMTPDRWAQVVEAFCLLETHIEDQNECCDHCSPEAGLCERCEEAQAQLELGRDAFAILWNKYRSVAERTKF